MLNNKTAVKILSVLIAIILWAYVMGEVTPTSSQTLKDVKVNVVNEEVLNEEGLALSGSTDYRVNVTLEGKRSIVKNVEKDELDVTADVQGYKRGTHYVEVRVEPTEDVKVTDIKDSKIKIKVEKLVSVKKKVNIVLTGNSSGAELKGQTSSPETVEVSGARTDVDKVRHVNAPVSAKALEKGNGAAEVSLVAVDGSGDEVKTVDLSTDRASIQGTVMKTKSVPLKVKIKGESSNKYDISIDIPEEVTIKGTSDDIDKVSEIRAKAIDVSDVTSTTKFKLELSVPDNAEVTTDADELVAVVTVN